MDRHTVLRWVARRMLIGLLVIACVTVLTFTLIHLAPGDPIYLLAGDGGSPSYYDEMRAKYGLDRPLLEQLVRYTQAVLTLDLGYSFMYQAPVAQVLLDHAPPSMILGSAALLLATVVGFAAGTFAAFTRSSARDAAIRGGATLLYAAPVFWTGQMLMLVLAVRAQWLPVAGMTSAHEAASAWAQVVDIAWHLVLPAVTLSLPSAAVVARVTRASVHETLGEPFLQAAAARGSTPGRIVVRHVIPLAAVPVVALVSQHATHIVAGAALTETIFGWPGVGYLVFHASVHRDYPLVIGAFIMIAASVVFLNALADLLHAWLDPRVALT